MKIKILAVLMALMITTPAYALWNLLVHPAQLTDVTTEQCFAGTGIVSLTAGAVAHIQLRTVFPGSPVDPLHVTVFTSVDASSEVWDALAWTSFDISPVYGAYSFIVRDIYKFKVCVSRAGETDTITSVDMYYRTTSAL